PCSEIHIDIRTDAEKNKVAGESLINSGHPHVIEIWNLVFIEFNRAADGKLENLPQKHVDTGMGFERLCMIVQNKLSNYDADVFESLIEKVEQLSGKTYGQDENINVAIRVAVDHVRAVAFSIADGQLPANVKAGYVIRRILRRSVRYGYTHLGMQTPFLYELVSVLADDFKDIFQEIESQKDLISKVIKEEEVSFLKTLEVGLKRLDEVIHKSKGKVIDGNIAFELYDTYGFPFDLTQLIAKENGFTIDEKVFDEEMSKQKDRARQATKVETGDWYVIKDAEVEFVGYDQHESEAEILKYRKIKSKSKEGYQIVFSPTPFYAESGGQVGDTGYLETETGEKISILDTQKENNLIVHFTDKIPEKVDAKIKAVVNYDKRVLTANNHSATHLLHAALRSVIGDHVQQKGSLVNADHLRFDFSHFQKVTDDELKEIERTVNKKIRENIQLDEKREVPFDDAVELGATALFGEKYGDKVRVIIFDPEYSIELCGGIHVNSTGQIGQCKIISESAIAAGVRRIEAITADKAEDYINTELETLTSIKEAFKNPNDLLERVNSLIKKNNDLQKELEGFTKNKIGTLKESLINNCKDKGDINFIAEIVDLPDSEAVKSLSFDLKRQVDNLFLVLGAKFNGKAHISVMLSDNLVKDKGWKANEIIKELASEIQGGGGGQAFFASAGGKDPGGLQSAMDKARKIAEA
ncbi:MAG: alanine--tRNA ligase, partial [Bacteroidia bacterium]|nr:alanine--tRNA ligase [Bacteroidia bacterium]